MKKLNFETRKGKFVVVDLPNAIHFLKHKGYIVQSCTDKLDLLRKCNKIDNGDTNGFWYIGNTTSEYVLKDITEQQASEIVDSFEWSDGFKVYNNYLGKNTFMGTFTAIVSLYSLIISKGYSLYSNPKGLEPSLICMGKALDWQQNEDKTFFNPIIFKLV